MTGKSRFQSPPVPLAQMPHRFDQCRPESILTCHDGGKAPWQSFPAHTRCSRNSSSDEDVRKPGTRHTMADWPHAKARRGMTAGSDGADVFVWYMVRWKGSGRLRRVTL